MRYMRHPQHGVLPVEDTGRVATLTKLGWEEYDQPTKHVDVPVQMAPEPAPPPESDERLALIAAAEAAGVRVDRRWGNERIRTETESRQHHYTEG